MTAELIRSRTLTKKRGDSSNRANGGSFYTHCTLIIHARVMFESVLIFGDAKRSRDIFV